MRQKSQTRQTGAAKAIKDIRRATREQARADAFDYIEFFYNPKRKQGRNGMLSPVDFERQQNWKLQGV